MSHSKNSDFVQVIRYGRYYYPASDHYPVEMTKRHLAGEAQNRVSDFGTVRNSAKVVCDRCQRQNIEECIGYNDLDLCLACAKSVARFSNPELQPGFVPRDERPDRIAEMVTSHSRPVSDIDLTLMITSASRPVTRMRTSESRPVTREPLVRLDPSASIADDDCKTCRKDMTYMVTSASRPNPRGWGSGSMESTRQQPSMPTTNPFVNYTGGGAPLDSAFTLQQQFPKTGFHDHA